MERLQSVSTERVTLTIGVTAGYGHENEDAQLGFLEKVVETAILLAGQVNEETGVYPSFVATAGKVGYSHDWGCPQGGEDIVVLSGERNPAFCDNAVSYKLAWERLTFLLMEEFGQTTATLQSTEVNLTYYKR